MIEAGGMLPVTSIALAIASAVVILASLGVLFVKLSAQKAAHSAVQKKAGSASEEAKKDEQQEQEQVAPLKPAPVLVLFGTQTGTAEGFAKTVTKELKQSLGQRADVIMADLDEFGANDDVYREKLSAPHVTALLLLATYGDGEPTDNAARFCRFLSAAAEQVEAAEDQQLAVAEAGLGGLTFAVFGLGNRQYEHFNAAAKAVDKQLASLGARRLIDLGLGDDDQCMEDDFEAWRAKLGEVLPGEVEAKWKALNSDALGADASAADHGHMNGHAKGEEAASSAQDEEDESAAAAGSLQVTFLEELSSAPALHEAFTGGELWHQHDITLVPLAVCRELHSPASTRSCLHVELSLPDHLTYSPGDHVAVFPQNEDADVAWAAELLGLKDRLSSVFSLVPQDQGAKAPSLDPALARPMRVETALRCLVDLHSSPKKAALLAMAQHASDPAEAARLRLLASPAGKDEYKAWVLQAQRSLLEVLAAFPSVRPPLGVFLTALAPRLQPRFYSISSSLAHTPSSLSITCSVVDDVTPGGRRHLGVCSTFLKRKGAASPASPVPVFLRPSTFRLPPSSATPIIMIGPGTGLAPFRGFLQERQALARAGRAADLGHAVLFFGCRSRQQDYIYEEELREWQEGGVLQELHVAFSRDGPEKVYVQHHLEQQREKVWNLWHQQGGFLYVCGDAKHMARDVHSTLLTVAQSQGKMTSQEAEAAIKQMQQEGRYQRDVW